MNVAGLRFCANLETVQAASKLANYQPVTFPPQDDFVVSVDKDGDPLSRYGDDYWNYKAYGFEGFNFGKQALTPENNDRLKQLTFICLYHMPLFPGKPASVKHQFLTFTKLCKLADKHKIAVEQLYCFPQLANDVINAIRPAQHQQLISYLSALLREEDLLGWKIADTAFIEQLAKLQIPHMPTQNAYIPPRIWMSLIQSTEQVMDDFERHQEEFTKAWTWVCEAYQHNQEQGYFQLSPFLSPNMQTDHSNQQGSSRKPRRVYPNGASAFFEDRGISELLNRWVGDVPDARKKLASLTSYAILVRDSAFTYILAHSIQRAGEGLALRSDCFETDDDPKLGKVGLLVGETTKTDTDSDARWIVPLSVERAVKILNDISQLRINTTLATIDPETIKNPYLMTGTLEPWFPSNVQNVSKWDLGKFIKHYPLAFKEDMLTITQEDYTIAYQLTPRLKEKSWFKVGGVWSFNAHQLRRTLAVNLFTSNVPERVIQWLMKHKTLQQSYYYGRNYTRLRVNGEASRTVMIEAYRTAVGNLVDIAENNLGDHVHAIGKNLMDAEILNLIREGEYKKLEVLVKKGLVAARPTLLGFCMVESCEYGGVESAVHCAGVDGKSPCKDAVFSKKNGKRLKSLQDSNAVQLKNLPKNSPRYSKLKNEIEAIEVYFHATS